MGGGGKKNNSRVWGKTEGGDQKGERGAQRERLRGTLTLNGKTGVVKVRIVKSAREGWKKK